MNQTGKHIVILIPGFAADESDTTCIPVTQHFIRTYTSQYPEDMISVISFQYPFKRKKYKWNGVDIYAMGGRNSRFPFRFITWLRVTSCFRKINKSKPVDVIQAYWLTECAYIGQILAKKYHLKCIVTARGQDCLAKNKYLKYLKLNDLYIVVLSKFLEEKLFKITGRQADEIIPHGESRPFLSYDLKGQRDIDILAVGSVVKVKNYGLFVEIISEIKDEFPLLNCIVVGNQPDRKEAKRIKDMINDHDLADHIKLIGQVDHQYVMKYMIRSKILLHTSLFEGQGMVFSEALGSGSTVVCFEVGHTYPYKMIVCKSKSDMVEDLRNLLRKNELNFNPLYFETMADQAMKYHRIYHS